eukprot:scaffold2615_cov146-Chaetoceros_neogracile.AAC.1
MDIDDSPTDYPTLSVASNPSPSDDASDPSLHVNRLSDAAKFELWHQRLGHTGTRKLEEAHKCVTGVPKLRGNAFYKCPSCMSFSLMLIVILNQLRKESHLTKWTL